MAQNVAVWEVFNILLMLLIVTMLCSDKFRDDALFLSCPRQ